MDLNLAGQVVGRIFASYLIVWVIMLFIARFDWKKSFYYAHRWYGFVLLVVIFLLGISSHLYTKGVI